MLFSTDPDCIAQNVSAGVSAIIVDWERNGKDIRQSGADTQISTDTIEDLERVRGATEARVICRINGYGEATRFEVDQAICAGADEILLPMVRSAADVARTIDHARARCGVGVLIETLEAVENAESIAALPISRAYLGLNDLAIARRSPSIFGALVDGTLAAVRPCFDVPFGFGGLTLPEKGSPVPCRLLMSLMAGSRSSFSFLRRSYHRDIAGRDPRTEVPRILAAIESARRRSEGDIAQDVQELAGMLAA